MQIFARELCLFSEKVLSSILLKYVKLEMKTGIAIWSSNKTFQIPLA